MIQQPEQTAGEEVAKKKSATLGFSGSRLAELREKAEKTQFQLGVVMDKDPTAISRWERGLAIPDANEAARLAAALGVGIEDLFE